MNVIDVSYLPPDGAKLIVTGGTSGGTNGIYAVDAKTGSQVRTIVAPDPSVGIDYVRLSPDGSRLAYVAAATKLESPSSYRVHVVGIDGANDITLPLPPRAVFQDAPAWSNDGTSLAITRGYAQHNEDMAVAVVPADGSGVGVESTHGLTGCCDTGLQWSPDDRSILILPEELNDGIPKQQLLLDPVDRQVRAGAVDGEDPSDLAASVSLGGCPRAAGSRGSCALARPGAQATIRRQTVHTSSASAPWSSAAWSCSQRRHFLWSGRRDATTSQNFGP